MVKPVERQGRQGFSGFHRFHQPVCRGTKQVQCMTVMIPASVLHEKLFEHFRPFPVGRQQRGAGGIPLAEHEREMVRIPICAAGG